MGRNAKVCVLGSALALTLAMSSQRASSGPLNANPAAPRMPQIGTVTRSVAVGQQQQSLWGVQTTIQQKRDRLHGTSGAGEAHSRTSNE